MYAQERSCPEGYELLDNVLQYALKRASQGKGKRRHATDRPFHQQPICEEIRLLGTEAAVYQIRKKALESLRLSKLAAAEELHDVIVYAAAACIVLVEGVTDDERKETSRGKM